MKLTNKILAALLALMMLISVVACTTDTPPASSGEPTPEQTPAGTPAESTPEASTPEESTPAESTPIETPPVVNPSTGDLDLGEEYAESGVLSKGALWYYEDFEKYPLTVDAIETANVLGWTYDMSSDAQFTSNTAQYTIADFDGSRQLFVRNIFDNADDSFITFLSDRQFGYLHRQNYTFQYDMTYTAAGNGGRYIALINAFNGSNQYYSAYIRNGGYGGNECINGTTSPDFDSSIATQGANSVANRILGKGSRAGAFNNISISVRVAINWKNGIRMYIRVNDDGYPGSDVWTLVSESGTDHDAKPFFNRGWSDAALGFKVAGKQNGYIDNIVVWCGNGDEPADKSNPFLTSKTPCHKIIEAEGKKLCALCGKNESAIAKSWLLTELPKYEGGAYSDKTYLNGQGLDSSMPLEREGKMQIITGTNETEFLAYVKKLEAEGYAIDFSRELDGNVFRSLKNSTHRVYTYYIAATNEVRVIYERLASVGTIADFCYSYEPKAGESSAVYMYALPLRDATHKYADGYVDRGMFFVIKLADNSVIVIDGGEACQFNEAQLNNLMSFLREITGVGENGKVKIASWYLTHAHGDHYQGFAMLLKYHHDEIELQRVMYNVPSDHIGVSVVSNSGLKKVIGYIKQYYGNLPFLKLHTGMTVQLADVTIDVLYTHEDLVDPLTGVSEIGGNYNESSAVSKFIFGGGKSFLCTGDIDAKASSILLQNWKAETLHSDVLQLAHHVLNNLSYFYDVIKSPVLIVPQSLHRIQEHKVAPTPYAAAKKYAKDNMIYFQNVETVGLGVENGEIKKIYSKPIIYIVNKTLSW